jgi:NAD(P)-dependent dehydrogenase (short-subunit alcohol dehydrogenase family)
VTDIRRHLPRIERLLGDELQRRSTAGILSVADAQAIRSSVRALLPASYGVGHGEVMDGRGTTSLPMMLVIYDRTLAREVDYQEHDRYLIDHVLAACELHLDLDSAALAAALDRLARVKALRRRTKGGLPVGLMVFLTHRDHPWREAASVEGLALALRDALAAHRPAVHPERIRAVPYGLVYDKPAAAPAEAECWGLLRVPDRSRPRGCYVCKAPYVRRHFFYDQLCPSCGDLNFGKRRHTADLGGRLALVTGARVHIGFAVALALLRAGGAVIATTRFPYGAARRYAQEPDFADWGGRLRLCALDLRRLSDVEQFALDLCSTGARLDVLINNAAQTVRPAPSYVDNLLRRETELCRTLPEHLQALVAPATGHEQPALTALHGASLVESSFIAVSDREAMVPRALAPAAGDANMIEPPTAIPPDSKRRANSWMRSLHEIPPLELLEVQVINAIAPTMLISLLRPLMVGDGGPASYVINVSSMEGQFAQSSRGRHPHTNMAKAALNMLTHSIAEEYAGAGIYVNSVDPGWVSEQAPRLDGQATGSLPLDVVDAAARICDPIFTGVSTGRHIYGKLLKDYAEVPW